jgi:hypothetical protein
MGSMTLLLISGLEAEIYQVVAIFDDTKSRRAEQKVLSLLERRLPPIENGINMRKKIVTETSCFLRTRPTHSLTPFKTAAKDRCQRCSIVLKRQRYTLDAAK